MNNEIIIQENDLDWVFECLTKLYIEDKITLEEFSNLAWSL